MWFAHVNFLNLLTADPEDTSRGTKLRVSIMSRIAPRRWCTLMGASPALTGDIDHANINHCYERSRSPMLIGGVRAAADASYGVDPGFLRHMDSPILARLR